ncbi:MAG: type II toxin-antitoxin system Phd/YefM family antitoxin [Clostridiales bacterium]|jgi:antitoxin (DNA-binding transcriptional repressor) of toxin-antitoxin stability system|nr:type II toxin-antitoxin system Phd/YefM family antitoxin [Clostridiales bacterium]
MIITSTELKTNLGKYLDMLETDDIIITRNGRKFAKLTREEDNALTDIRSLFGILKNSPYAKMNDDQIKEAIHEGRAAQHERLD